NTRIGDLLIRCQKESLRQDDRQCLVAFEGNKQLILTYFSALTRRYDAQVLVIGFHEDIARPQMNLVCSKFTAYHEELISKLAALGNFQARHESFKHLLSGL